MPSVTLNNPTVDGWIRWDEDAGTYFRNTGTVTIDFYKMQYGPPPKYNWFRGYVEWDISGILDGSTITKVEFRYEGEINPATDNCYIYAMATQPSTQPDNDAGNQTIWDDAGDGVAYLDNDAVFPEVAVNKDVGGATGPAWDNDPCAALQALLGADWFAFGFKNSEVTMADTGSFYSEEYVGPPTPPPTLYVEYDLPVVGWTGKISGVTDPAKIMGVDVADIASVKGVA